MRGSWTVPWVAACLLAYAGPALADTDVAVSGQVRVRSELDKRTFAPDAIGRQYTDLRTRVTVAATMSENTRAVVQLQDSRRLGGLDDEGDAVSGTLIDDTGVGVHEAYLAVERLWEGGVGLRAGRFEVNLGNERVFGAVGWHNVGRAWEGIDAWLPLGGGRIQALWLKRLEADAPDENRDFDVFVLTGRAPGPGIEPLVVFERDAAPASPVLDGGDTRLRRVSAGAYGAHTFGAVDIQGNAMVQLGDRSVVADDAVVEQDIRAFLVTAEIGWRASASPPARVAVGVDVASGDEDPLDDTYGAYDNLYYTGHKSRGFMDYFLASSPAGLVDLVLRGRVSPAEGWMLLADLHVFRRAEVQDGSTRAVGVELDLVASTTRIAGVAVETGASVFFPSESFAGSEESDPGLWAYAMLTASFGGK